MSKYVAVLETEMGPLNFDKLLQGAESGYAHQVLEAAISEYAAALQELVHGQALLAAWQTPHSALLPDDSSSNQQGGMGFAAPELLVAAPDNEELEKLASLVEAVVDTHQQFQESQKDLLSRLEAIKHSTCPVDHSVLSASQLSASQLSDTCDEDTGAYPQPIDDTPAPRAPSDDPRAALLEEMGVWYHHMLALQSRIGGLEILPSRSPSRLALALSPSRRQRLTVQFAHGTREMAEVILDPPSPAAEQTLSQCLALDPSDLVGMLLSLREAVPSLYE